ncbi:MAG: hypothetical protein L6Q92_11300 [Phycisphaerae bacterium]|nr:hypothetical protein [Phycisphaerae bacterium]
MVDEEDGATQGRQREGGSAARVAPQVRFMNRTGRMLRRSTCALGLLLVGCGDPTSRPAAKLEEPSEVAQAAMTAVHPTDLGPSESNYPANGGRILDAGETAGRFPCAVAVARVIRHEVDGGEQDRLMVVPISDARGATWNQLMDTLPSIREFVLLGVYGLPVTGCTVDQILDEARRASCRLCLIYAQNGDAATDCELLGVLWDAIGPKPIATFRTSAEVRLDANHRCKSDGKHDHRLCRAEYVATRELESAVQRALWTLAERDRPVTTTQPNPWESHRPTSPGLFLGDREIIIRPRP